MSDAITLYSFADVDRSGKVRWVAHELGLTVDERRLSYPQHLAPPYTDLNPLRQVPTVLRGGKVLLESTAICHLLAESTTDPKLWIGPGEPHRDLYLYWLAASGETLETRMVDCAVSKAGILGPEYLELHSPLVKRKLQTLASQLPPQGWVAGDRFTIADIVTAYAMRLGVETGMLQRDEVDPWMSRAMARPAARASHFFAGLD